MQYSSTSQHTQPVSLKTAIMRGIAPDSGLYMPTGLRHLPKAVFNNISEMSPTEISYFVANTLFSDDLPSSVIKQIGEETFNFPMPLVKVEDNIYALELFHGPTLAIKDIGSRFMARLMRAFHTDANKPLNVLVATNGNSGAAIANGFYGLPGVNVFAMYPKTAPADRVNMSSLLGGNIHAIKVSGTIDDCRAMIAEALSDQDLNRQHPFTCANSTNIGRLLPQAITLFHAYAGLAKAENNPGDIYVSVPTGNGGQLLAAAIAMEMGLPISKLVAGTNANGAFAKYLAINGLSVPPRNPASTRTLAYAMDTCWPSNAPRFDMLCKGDKESLRRMIEAHVCTDDMICDTIKDTAKRTGYLLDPHSAVAYSALKASLPPGATGIFLASAHPAQSAGLINKLTGMKIDVPSSLKRYNSAPSLTIMLPPTYPALKKHIASVIG